MVVGHGMPAPISEGRTLTAPAATINAAAMSTAAACRAAIRSEETNARASVV